jgi:hypothetical protein
MATGFIYVVTTVGKDYEQASFRCAPTNFRGTLYLAACKVPIRRKLKVGDYLFGISPSGTAPRRLVFAARVARKMTFAEAYDQYPDLRGPKGPIHVQPTALPLKSFPDSKYEHIGGAGHADRWRNDLRTPDLDAFFACESAGACVGKWLGAAGPPIQGDLLDFLRGCSVHGNVGELATSNSAASETTPVKHGRLFTGLHLETTRPEKLLDLVCGHVKSHGESPPTARALRSQPRSCEPRKSRVRRGC